MVRALYFSAHHNGIEPSFDPLVLMNLFIDTNVFLSFFHLSSDDLEELRKLVVLLRGREVKLWLPDQVNDEFFRNREIKIADALKRFRDQRFNLQYPQMSKDYEEYETLRTLQRNFEEGHAALQRKIESDAIEGRLKADEVIRELFAGAERIHDTPEIVSSARHRHDLGNPPGKPESLGDAVNWESLLVAIPDEEDIHFISEDGDYTSALSASTFNRFLSAEWTAKKRGSVIFYRKLSSFFRDHFPNIRIASDYEKGLLIRSLANSGSFAETHAAIGRLHQHLGEFTAAQASAIISAAVTNNQVYWIINDEDIREFLVALIEAHQQNLEATMLETLRQIMGDVEADDDNDDLPF